MVLQPKLEIGRCHTTPEEFEMRDIKPAKPTSKGDRDGSRKCDEKKGA
jgi:hypothetical protein